ncbi:MAG: (2Fe-2S)-binding protein [Trichocoleus desertorum ATA4-8-CV12]|jgi:ferredoxin|nr:(2Fe-2S)-binding protein [Trichocoleus desertorum ATA4-8-CV12]
MPQITAQGKTFICDRGANLRQVLLQNNVALHNGNASFINCHGLGSCGTCAVEVEGEVAEPNWRDRTRRSLPPHDTSQNRRLACQTKVLGDIRVTKFDGFWGQGTQPLWTPEG